MMTSTEICNLALSILKSSAISDIDSRDPKANLCKRWYSLKKQSILTENSWRFAIKKLWLSKNINGNFLLPGDLIKVIKFSDEDAMQIGNEVVSYSNELEIYYMGDVDESLFTPDFIQVFVFFLAHALSFELVGDKAVSKNIEEQYQILLMKARANNNIEYPLRKKKLKSELLRVRYA